MLMDPQVTLATLKWNGNSELTRCRQACVSDIYSHKLQAAHI